MNLSRFYKFSITAMTNVARNMPEELKNKSFCILGAKTLG
jgi:hypothetical protein